MKKDKKYYVATLRQDLINAEFIISSGGYKTSKSFNYGTLDKYNEASVNEMMNATTYEKFYKAIRNCGDYRNPKYSYKSIINKILSKECLIDYFFKFIFDIRNYKSEYWLSELISATSIEYFVNYIKNHKEQYSISSLDPSVRKKITTLFGFFETDDELYSQLEEKLPYYFAKGSPYKRNGIEGITNKGIIHNVFKSGESVVGPFGEIKTIYRVRIFSYYNGVSAHETSREFDSFYDFVKYLDNDLSRAHFDKYNDIAKYISEDPDKYILTDVLFSKEEFVNKSYTKEDTTALITEYGIADTSTKNELDDIPEGNEISAHILPDVSPEDIKFYYISDLHLEFRFENSNVNKYEQYSYISKLAHALIENLSPIDQDKFVIIDGDVSCHLDIFKDFLKIFKDATDYYNYSEHKIYIIFTLGNHELADHDTFASLSLEQIIEKYRSLIESNGFFLLHNSLLYWDAYMIPHQIKELELESISKTDLMNILCSSKINLFGGTGFAAWNTYFNADIDLYNKALNRQQEIIESAKFAHLYKKICECANNSKVIVVSHMPKGDWSGNYDYHIGFIYVYGHNHLNRYIINDKYQVYGDNQIGYYGYATEFPSLKYFTFSTSIDPFKLIEDGIYEVTKTQYDYFLKSKNIDALIKREFYRIYMIKKYGIYMFVSESKTRNLCLLNGGASKALPLEKMRSKNNPLKSKEDILRYLYDNLEYQFDWFTNQLEKYHECQVAISKDVMRIGGTGTIHGCIVDIDFYDHIYLNPVDGTITHYHAPDMMSRIVYPSLEDLLSKHCPKLYSNLIEEKERNKNKLVLTNDESTTSVAIRDYGTYLYKNSRELNKIQKIYKGILSEWSADAVKLIEHKAQGISDNIDTEIEIKQILEIDVKI